MKIHSKLAVRVLTLIVGLSLVPVILGDAVQITGYVRDNSGNPVADVDVTGDDYVGDSFPSTTDTNGYYSVEFKGEGNYRVTANCDQLTERDFSCPSPGAATLTSGSTEINFTVYPVIPPLWITNTVLPEGEAGVSYRVQLTAKGGRKPYLWRLAYDSTNLPAGLVLNPGGLLSGRPVANGAATINVHLTDANYTVTNRMFTITINSGSLGTSAAPSNNLPTQ